MKTIKMTRSGNRRYANEMSFSVVGAADSQQKKKPQKGGDDEGGEKGDGPKKMAKKGEKLKEEMDSVIEEIDEVTEDFDWDSIIERLVGKSIAPKRSPARFVRLKSGVEAAQNYR